MPPRPKMRVSSRSLAYRPRLNVAYQPWSQQLPLHAQRCAFSDKRPIEDRPFEDRSTKTEEEKGPNMDPLPHVSEEAAATNKSMGGSGPDIESQGSPVSEVVKGDKEAQENLPKVMQEQLKKKQQQQSDKSNSSAKRSFSTFARAQPRVSPSSLSAHLTSSQPKSRVFSTSSLMRTDLELHSPAEGNFEALQQLRAEARLPAGTPESTKLGGLKFDPPTPPTPGSHMRNRYEPIVDQVTKLLMRDGKLSVAQRNMSIILTHLRTSPAPRPSNSAVLIPNAPPHSALPFNPTIYLTVALDSIAPLFRLRSQKGLAGGGLSVQIPVSLHQRQRRRTAVMWILDQVKKRAGGTSPFAKRFAEEIVAIVEGRSSLWERRTMLHGQGMRNRTNLTAASRARR